MNNGASVPPPVQQDMANAKSQVQHIKLMTNACHSLPCALVLGHLDCLHYITVPGTCTKLLRKCSGITCNGTRPQEALLGTIMESF